MKKFLQICLIAVLIFVVFQAVVGGALMASSHSQPVTASQTSSTSNTSSEGMQMAACLVSIKGVICVTPNVGWNS
jgi:ABC-type uncharacterized transport system permease subunit